MGQMRIILNYIDNPGQEPHTTPYLLEIKDKDKKQHAARSDARGK